MSELQSQSCPGDPCHCSETLTLHCQLSQGRGNHYHHTCTPSTYPQAISSIESEAMVDAEVEEGDGVMDKLSSVDQM